MGRDGRRILFRITGDDFQGKANGHSATWVPLSRHGLDAVRYSVDSNPRDSASVDLN